MGEEKKHSIKANLVSILLIIVGLSTAYWPIQITTNSYFVSYNYLGYPSGLGTITSTSLAYFYQVEGNPSLMAASGSLQVSFGILVFQCCMFLLAFIAWRRR